MKDHWSAPLPRTGGVKINLMILLPVIQISGSKYKKSVWRREENKKQVLQVFSRAIVNLTEVTTALLKTCTFFFFYCLHHAKCSLCICFRFLEWLHTVKYQGNTHPTFTWNWVNLDTGACTANSATCNFQNFEVFQMLIGGAWTTWWALLRYYTIYI